MRAIDCSGPEGPCEPSAGDMRRLGQCEPDPLGQARSLRGLEEDDLALLLRVDENQPGAVERQRLIRREKVILEVLVLGDPEFPSNAFDPRDGNRPLPASCTA